MKRNILAIIVLVAFALNASAQDVSKVQFCDKKFLWIAVRLSH